MEKYINQLVDLIREATNKIKPPHEIWDNADPDYDVELEDLSHVEKFIYGEELPISQITGIDVAMLPPPDKLTYEQQAMLASELEGLLINKHFFLDFPQTFPADRRYPFIRKFWSENHVELSFGENHIEFCSYEKDCCPFPCYCTTCDEVEEQFRLDEERSKRAQERGYDDDIELPF